MPNDPLPPNLCEAVEIVAEAYLKSTRPDVDWDYIKRADTPLFKQEIVNATAALRALLDQGFVVQRDGSGWQPIDENTPLGRDVLVGWWKTFPFPEWCVEYGRAGSPNSYRPDLRVSDAWMHGQATHWLDVSLPSAPVGAADER